MDGLDWRVAVTATMISILMVSQCAGKARASAKPHNAQYQEEKRDENWPSSKAAGSTERAFPVNPYVFSAEDYDVLQQNAESAQGARSIVSYEPRRIDRIDRIDTKSSPSEARLASAAPQRNLYQVPRRTSPRSRDVSAPSDASPAYESSIAQRGDRLVSAATTTTTTTTTSATSTLKPTQLRSPRRSPTQRQGVIDQEPAGMTIVLNDRMPRPFGFTTEASLTTRTYHAPQRYYKYRSTPSAIFSNPTVSSGRAPTGRYESIEPLTTQTSPLVYTIPKRKGPWYATAPIQQTTATPNDLQRPRHAEEPTAVAVQESFVYSQVPVVEETDYDEPPTGDAAPPARDDDRREYNYSHVERYEEPAKSNEELDEPQQASDRIAPVAQVHDLVTEADHQRKAHQKPKHHHEEGEEGAEQEHSDEGHHEKADKGHEGYKDYEEHEDAEKGHRVKEGHDHRYDEEGGDENKHHDEAGYHEEHEHGEEGDKKAAFHEKGKHNKGHSTKGEHVVHKKDEFEKKIEFYDESHEGGDEEKEGGHHHEHRHKKGHHHKKAHHHKGHDQAHKGHKGHSEKGHHHHTKKGHSKERGDEHHHDHEEKYGKKAGHGDSKHWHHKKGKRR